MATRDDDQPSIREIALKFANVDCIREPIPVVPTILNGADALHHGDRFTISTRRFFARPSSVRLSATGRSWPMPTGSGSTAGW
jgi:hypothetical protein